MRLAVPFLTMPKYFHTRGVFVNESDYYGFHLSNFDRRDCGMRLRVRLDKNPLYIANLAEMMLNALPASRQALQQLRDYCDRKLKETP